MKKLLLLAMAAASVSPVFAAGFNDYFALSCGDETLTNGQTVTISTYYDAILMDNPEFGDIPGYVSTYTSQARIKAANVTDEAMDIAFKLTCVDNVTNQFQLCFEFDDAAGNCLGAINGEVNSPDDLRSVNPEGYIMMDVDQVGFTEPTPATFKLDLYVTEGGDKIEGTDCTVYVSFTHEKDITAAVDGIQAEDGAEEYYNLQGMRVAEPEKGGIYLVRKGSKVTKRLF